MRHETDACQHAASRMILPGRRVRELPVFTTQPSDHGNMAIDSPRFRTALLLLLASIFLIPASSWGQAPPDPNLGEAGTIKKADQVPAAQPVGEEVNPAAAPAAVKKKKHVIPTDPLEIFQAGGFAMWPLLLASIISLWFVLERMVVLRRRRVLPPAFVNRFIQHLEQGKLNAETALRLCEENLSPIADVFAHGIRKWGKPSVEIEQAIIDGGERQVAKLRAHLRIINGVASVAPLLGLLGTVVGMIMSFNELAQGESGSDKSQRLAAGIGVALITTASGLFVAIPSLISYMYLADRVDRLVMEMDGLGQKIVELISSDTLANRSRAVSKAPSPAGNPAAAVSSKPKTVGT